MTDIRFNLELFSESAANSHQGSPSGSEVSTAENSPADTDTAKAEDKRGGEPPSPSREANTVPDSAGTEATDSHMSRLCEALGIEGIDGEELIDLARTRRQRSELSEILKAAAAAREYERLSSEAVAFAQKVEGFDLNRELGDRRFAALLHAGFSVEEAFRAVHFEQLLESAVEDAKRTARESVLEKIRLGADRPEENGAGGASPARTTTDVRSLTGKGIRDILRRVEKGAKVKF